jgi:hypothetical protein
VTSPLLVRGDDGEWSSPQTSRYDDESHLQKVVAEQPSLIPGVSAAARTACELSTVAGPIDVCAVDTDGQITVVECKLSSNSERRRMVIGQVIDYASALWAEGPESFRGEWNRRTGDDLREVLDEEAFERLVSNISTPRIHLCLAVDLIDEDLRRLVEYVNRSTTADTSVTALQLSYARHGDVEILSPTTFGNEVIQLKLREQAQGSERWTEERYLDQLEMDSDRDLANKLLTQVKELVPHGESSPIWFGLSPGGFLILHPHGLRFGPIGLWRNSSGRAMVTGLWNNWQSVQGHSGYQPVAKVLQQSVTGPASGVLLADLNIDELWTASIESALLVNAQADPNVL